RFVLQKIYSRERFLMIDSDVGLFVGDTPYGEMVARNWNSKPELLGYYRDQVDKLCPENYELSVPFLVER
ncbi:HB2L protein, partial [Sylvia borin]|nr:HB2L protein [Sylvia borin]